MSTSIAIIFTSKSDWCGPSFKIDFIKVFCQIATGESIVVIYLYQPREFQKLTITAFWMLNILLKKFSQCCQNFGIFNLALGLEVENFYSLAECWPTSFRPLAASRRQLGARCSGRLLGTLVAIKNLGRILDFLIF